jgi:hypothetical protein
MTLGESYRYGPVRSMRYMRSMRWNLFSVIEGA